MEWINVNLERFENFSLVVSGVDGNTAVIAWFRKKLSTIYLEWCQRQRTIISLRIFTMLENQHGTRT